MEKRQFLSSTAGLIAGPLVGALGSTGSSAHANPLFDTKSPVILTISGEIERANRKGLNMVSDHLMHNQKIHFDRAFTFTFDDLEKLPLKTISPTLHFDRRVHKLSGPRLIDVLGKAGIKNSKDATIIFRCLDGYSTQISYSLAQKYDFILATRLDDEPLTTGGLGPLFGACDVDRIDDFAKKPLNQRFAGLPWFLYFIEVKV
ncbi:MAG: oxidoreductase molybdopterin binding domain protein [Solimicrobium sp.]|jgi:hypothetical protein|nr:oxidoreductase molybdopterin binding domain protein [Solimicrobium sp.]